MAAEAEAAELAQMLAGDQDAALQRTLEAHSGGEVNLEVGRPISY